MSARALHNEKWKLGEMRFTKSHLKRLMTPILAFPLVFYLACHDNPPLEAESNSTVIQLEIGDLLTNADLSFSAGYVNLLDSPAYVEHQRDLKSIDGIRLTCRIYNLGSETAAGQLWVANDGPLSNLPAERVLVLDSLQVAPGELILLDQSDDYMPDFEEVRQIVQNEKFTFYFTSTQTPFALEMRDLVLILSITLGRN